MRKMRQLVTVQVAADDDDVNSFLPPPPPSSPRQLRRENAHMIGPDIFFFRSSPPLFLSRDTRVNAHTYARANTAEIRLWKVTYAHVRHSSFP